MKLAGPLLLACTLLTASTTNAADSPSLVAPEDAVERVRSDEAVLIDVREPSEWSESGVVATAHLLPLSDLRGERIRWKEFLENHGDRELILYCRSGNRAGQAARLLADEGYNVANAGGLRDWVTARQELRQAGDQIREPDPVPAD